MKLPSLLVLGLDSFPGSSCKISVLQSFFSPLLLWVNPISFFAPYVLQGVLQVQQREGMPRQEARGEGPGRPGNAHRHLRGRAHPPRRPRRCVSPSGVGGGAAATARPRGLLSLAAGAAQLGDPTGRSREFKTMIRVTEITTRPRHEDKSASSSQVDCKPKGEKGALVYVGRK